MRLPRSERGIGGARAPRAEGSAVRVSPRSDRLAESFFRAQDLTHESPAAERIGGRGRGNVVAMGHTTVEVTKDNFKQVTEKDGIVLLDWWAAWCGPCKMFAPTYEKVAQKHPDITFGKIDTEASPELAGAFDIRSIPTLMILRDKVLLFSQPGALPEAALEDLIRQVRALDMEKVRAEIAAQDAKNAERPT